MNSRDFRNIREAKKILKNEYKRRDRKSPYGDDEYHDSNYDEIMNRLDRFGPSPNQMVNKLEDFADNVMPFAKGVVDVKLLGELIGALNHFYSMAAEKEQLRND
tara:strand:- start:876 stop:1187 length:312 start_codon:yes stop_codon:yes gene_type:complete